MKGIRGTCSICEIQISAKISSEFQTPDDFYFGINVTNNIIVLLTSL